VRTFISWLTAAGLRLLGRTWRITFEGAADLDGDNHLAGFWHRDLIVAAYLFRDRGFCVPVSRSGDGDLIASILERLHYAETPRGSSSRGGASALLSCVRLMREGRTLSVQTDGPRGPARQSKIGIATISRLAQVQHLGESLLPLPELGRPAAPPALRARDVPLRRKPGPLARRGSDRGGRALP
jgi:lysophospholipid acyltransferase (LPLAT)-like uncharacterized protein